MLYYTYKYDKIMYLIGMFFIHTCTCIVFLCSLFAKVGDPIIVMMNNTAQYFDVFTLPTPFNGMQCHDGNPISKLKCCLTSGSKMVISPADCWKCNFLHKISYCTEADHYVVGRFYCDL